MCRLKYLLTIIGIIMFSAPLLGAGKVRFGPCEADARRFCGLVSSTKRMVSCLNRVRPKIDSKCKNYLSILAKSASSKNSRSVAVKSKRKTGKSTIVANGKNGRKKKRRFKRSVQPIRNPGTPWFSYLFLLLSFVVMPISAVLLFWKMSLPQYQALIPFFNVWVLLREFDRPEIWNLYLLVPFLNLYYGYLICLDLVRRFAKNDSYAYAVLLLPFIFIPVLAFGSDQYIPNYGKEASDDGPDISLKDIKKIMKKRISKKPKELKKTAESVPMIVQKVSANADEEPSEISKTSEAAVPTGQVFDIGLDKS